MAEETKAPAAAAEEVVVSDVPVAEKPEAPAVVEKEAEPEAAGEAVVEGEKEKSGVAESTSFKEESNKVEELPNPEKKALDEFKQLIQEALNKHEFTAPPPPPPAAKEEEKKPAEEEPKSESKETEAAPAAEEPPKAEEKTEEVAAPPAAVPEPEPAPKEEEEIAAPPPPPTEEAPAEPAVVVVDEKAAPPAEEIKETIVEVAAAAPPAEEPAADGGAGEEEKEEEVPVPPPVPEEVSIWGIPLLADERSDVILLKFLRARDFKVKDAFNMLKSVVSWRKEFKIDELLEESELGGQGLDKVVYMHGVDKEGHPICYNSFGEFQDKELYQSTFSDKEKLNNFLRWRIQFMEKSIRNLDFSPDGICTFVQVIDLKNSPGLFFFKKELRQATNRALQLLQDNYPEFVAKQVFINVPWWYPSYYRMINALFTTRTKSKFVFAGPSKSAETLFKYIAPEQVPVQYGGLSREGDYEFTTADPAIEDTIKPTCKHTIELPVTENCTLVWEARVVGWDISYGAEFVPADEGAYTIIVEKSRKIGSADETIIGNTYKAESAGKVVLTFDNQTSKRKKLLYRSKTKAL